jgi:hypothetical protein
MSEHDTQHGAHGATAGTPPGAGPGALPMVVWLRGDEPVCDEFVLDAEHVMAQLGIRRSRLTQISGRELRVGRMRKGRYVSPVYRQVDVDAYSAWTRPTASHLKASTVLTDAAQALAHQKDELSEQIESGLDQAVAALEQQMRRASKAHEERLAQAEGRWREALATTEAALREALRLAALPVKELAQRVEATRGHVEQLAVAQAASARDLAELAALARLAREDGKRHEAGLDAVLATLSKVERSVEEVGGVERQLEALAEGVERHWETLGEQVARLRREVSVALAPPGPEAVPERSLMQLRREASRRRGQSRK